MSVSAPKVAVVQALLAAHPNSSQGRLQSELERVTQLAQKQGLDEAEIDGLLESWLLQFPRRTREWISADAALADIRRLLLVSESWWAHVWDWLRRIAQVAFAHAVPVAGAVAGVAGIFYGLAYARFYGSLDITPAQAGLSPSQIVTQSIAGGLVLVALLTIFFFCLVLGLVPMQDKNAYKNASGNWSDVFSNAIFALAGIGVMILLLDWAAVSPVGTALCVVPAVGGLVFASVRPQWTDGRIHLQPSPLAISLERYVIVLIACIGPALFFTGWTTIWMAKELGERASIGNSVRDPKIGIFPFLGVRAEPALVTWKPEDRIAPVPRCVLYLGSESGKLILYDHRSSSTFHVPDGKVALQLQSEMSSCEAPTNLRPPSTTRFGEGLLRCRPGRWRSRINPKFEYQWMIDGHPLPSEDRTPWIFVEDLYSPGSIAHCRVIATTPLGESAAVSAPVVIAG